MAHASFAGQTYAMQFGLKGSDRKIMDNRNNFSNWQDFLKVLLENPQERQRIAAQAEVTTITLDRWIKQISQPHRNNMRKLLQALPPAAYAHFVRLIESDFPELVQESTMLRRIYQDIPPEFYARILSAHAELPRPMCYQIIRDLIFQQGIEHLDPDRLGMSISLVCFVKPLEGSKVRSMRSVGGIGTFPWKRDLTQKTIFLGAESLAGHAVRLFHRVVVSNREAVTFFPVHWTEHEQSVVVVPIIQQGRVAGCLLAVSVVPDYFVEGQPPVLIFERYAQLTALLFEPDAFLFSEQIDLRHMPPYEQQAPYFREVNRLVAQQFRLAQVLGKSCTLDEARQHVWREIEEALIQDFLRNPSVW